MNPEIKGPSKDLTERVGSAFQRCQTNDTVGARAEDPNFSRTMISHAGGLLRTVIVCFLPSPAQRVTTYSNQKCDMNWDTG